MSAQQTNLGIVVGVDGSPCSHTAVEWAARDAQMRNVALRVVQVVPPVITAPEGWAFEYSRFQEAQKREIVEHSYTRAESPVRTVIGQRRAGPAALDRRSLQWMTYGPDPHRRPLGRVEPTVG